MRWRAVRKRTLFARMRKKKKGRPQRRPSCQCVQPSALHRRRRFGCAASDTQESKHRGQPGSQFFGVSFFPGDKDDRRDDCCAPLVRKSHIVESKFLQPLTTRMRVSATFRIDTHKTVRNATICQPKAISRMTQNALQICRTRQNLGCQGKKLPVAGATVYGLVRKSAANGYGMANRPHCRINCSRGGPRV